MTRLRIVNETDIDFRRLLVLYEKELDTIKGQEIDFIVFKPNTMRVWGMNESLLLEVKD